jgi:glycosyltransferase involved in cell wall biosynthesis
MSDKLDLSIIIPVCDEGENVGELYNELYAVLSRLGKTYEIIFVDDGYRDDTFK